MICQKLLTAIDYFVLRWDYINSWIPPPLSPPALLPVSVLLRCQTACPVLYPACLSKFNKVCLSRPLVSFAPLKLITSHVTVTYKMLWCLLPAKLIVSVHSHWTRGDRMKTALRYPVTHWSHALYCTHRLLWQTIIKPCMCADQSINIPIPISYCILYIHKYSTSNLLV